MGMFGALKGSMGMGGSGGSSMKQMGQSIGSAMGVKKPKPSMTPMRQSASSPMGPSGKLMQRMSASSPRRY